MDEDDDRRFGDLSSEELLARMMPPLPGPDMVKRILAPIRELSDQAQRLRDALQESSRRAQDPRRIAARYLKALLHGKLDPELIEQARELMEEGARAIQARYRKNGFEIINIVRLCGPIQANELYRRYKARTAPGEDPPRKADGNFKAILSEFVKARILDKAPRKGGYILGPKAPPE
jgi:hypothetical protein